MSAHAHPITVLTAARHVAIAVAVAMSLAVIGVVARWGYIQLVHPRAAMVAPLDDVSLSLAAEVGIAAAALELVFIFSGLRAQHCEAYFAR